VTCLQRRAMVVTYSNKIINKFFFFKSLVIWENILSQIKISQWEFNLSIIFLSKSLKSFKADNKNGRNLINLNPFDGILFQFTVIAVPTIAWVECFFGHKLFKTVVNCQIGMLAELRWRFLWQFCHSSKILSDSPVLSWIYFEV
jgi:hypothetical protein